MKIKFCSWTMEVVQLDKSKGLSAAIKLRWAVQNKSCEQSGAFRASVRMPHFIHGVDIKVGSVTRSGHRLISPTDDRWQKSFPYPLTEPRDFDILLCAVPASGDRMQFDKPNRREFITLIGADTRLPQHCPRRLPCKQIS